MDATITTVVSVGERVIEQDKDISKVKSDLDHLDERVDVVEEDLTDTKVKVEDIDNKVLLLKNNIHSVFETKLKTKIKQLL